VNWVETPKIKGKCNKKKYEAQQTKKINADFLKNAEGIILKNM
jgi:hypothetical protein